MEEVVIKQTLNNPLFIKLPLTLTLLFTILISLASSDSDSLKNFRDFFKNNREAAKIVMDEIQSLQEELAQDPTLLRIEVVYYSGGKNLMVKVTPENGFEFTASPYYSSLNLPQKKLNLQLSKNIFESMDIPSGRFINKFYRADLTDPRQMNLIKMYYPDISEVMLNSLNFQYLIVQGGSIDKPKLVDVILVLSPEDSEGGEDTFLILFPAPEGFQQPDILSYLSDSINNPLLLPGTTINNPTEL